MKKNFSRTKGISRKEEMIITILDMLVRLISFLPSTRTINKPVV